MREYVCLLPNEAAAEDTEKVWFSMFLLPQSFLTTLAFRNESQASETVRKPEAKSPLLEENQVQEFLEYPHQCVWWTHPGMAEELLSHFEAVLSYFWKVAMPALSLVVLNTWQDKALSNAVWH